MEVEKAIEESACLE